MSELFCLYCGGQIEASQRMKSFCSAEHRIAFRQEESQKVTTPKLRTRERVY